MRSGGSSPGSPHSPDFGSSVGMFQHLRQIGSTIQYQRQAKALTRVSDAVVPQMKHGRL